MQLIPTEPSLCPSLALNLEWIRQREHLSVLLVFENELDVLVGEGHQIGADQSHDTVQDCRLDQVHVPNPPEQP